MRISCKWLRELVNIPHDVNAEKIAHLLTMAGLEVEAREAFLADGEDEDTILTLSITPNRPDALSHEGIARELSALLDVALIEKARPDLLSAKIGAGNLSVELKDEGLCPRYSCGVLSKVKVGPSPNWLHNRLTALGINPVNNIVDISNYVMLENGHPLHAFDLDSLKLSQRKLVVRRAHAAEGLTTLDSVDRKLSQSDLVIADDEGPVALAGVMGGKHSEVHEGTQNILIESAFFEATVVRRASKNHVLSTDASYRFERGADPNRALSALNRAVELITNIAGGQLVEALDCYPRHIKPIAVSISSQLVARVSGLDAEVVSNVRIEQILCSLGFTKLEQTGADLRFEIPSFRPDITRSIDLVEEVLRIIGYDSIPEVATSVTSQLSSTFDPENMLGKIRDRFVYSGFREAINLSMGAPERIGAITPYADECVTLKNPLGADMSMMRQSLLPRLLENVAHNVRQNISRVRLFEIGTIFVPKNDHTADFYGQASSYRVSWADERLHVAAVLSGSYGLTGFNLQDKSADFYDIKGVLLQLLRALGCDIRALAADFELSSDIKNSTFLHPRSAVTLKAKNASGAVIEGFIGELHPDLFAAFGLMSPVMLLELNISDAVARGPGKKMFNPIPKFPGIDRDLALILDESTQAGEVVNFIGSQQILKPFLQNVSIFDVYRGSSLPEGKKSVALSLFFQNVSRTMTDEEINGMMAQLLTLLAAKFAAVVR